ncbi:hypothetical protein [Clostridium sp.]|uniref:hypothetical protein n=1 Tax=Clostridium sp. TaxID=1506 RepID=UPI001D99500A|nr:hypothetical protein [Clostridium sp.]MBS5937105.1 hypothetical protein [Clostridium sp.]
MANVKKITSFTAHTTAEGQRISYTYSEIDESGSIVIGNDRVSCIVLDNEVLGHIEKINEFLLNRENKTN